jgi:hypothetical protein
MEERREGGKGMMDRKEASRKAEKRRRLGRELQVKAVWD